MVFCLAVVGPLVAGLAIIKAIITLGAEIHLCSKCSESLKRDIDELREQLVPAEREHPDAAEEVRVLQLKLDRAAEDVIAEYQSKGLLRRLCTATQHLENLDDADKVICSAVEALLAKLNENVPNEVMSRFYNHSYARRHERSFWSILFKAKPSVAIISPPPSPSASAPGRSISRDRRRRHQAFFMGSNHNPFLSLLRETARKRKKWWACCLF